MCAPRAAGAHHGLRLRGRARGDQLGRPRRLAPTTGSLLPRLMVTGRRCLAGAGHGFPVGLGVPRHRPACRLRPAALGWPKTGCHEPPVAVRWPSRGPVEVEGQRVPALRFDAQATQALSQALVPLRLLHDGFKLAYLRALLAPALGLPPGAMTQGRMGYHLRRLRLHGLIERVPHSHRYTITDAGLSTSLFLSRAYSRFILGGMAEATGALGPPPPLRKALRALTAELDDLAARSGLAA
jgi:hypothetical protein